MNDYMHKLPERLVHDVVSDLEEVKAIDVTVLDVRNLTSITDFMIIATGRSKRHARALAENVVRASKGTGHPPLGVEGEQHGEWIIVDLCDVVVHVMLSEARDLYQLEKLWYTAPNRK
uniref:Ribosomal silencing factor RsfS n=1 Tax=Candidatus Kentrum sp. FM TaxID=2126340 RepID=A0A450WSM1_9GAMM|nr:MAG: ribosome-associated protein [Candidatus Kentron sp. FM]VFJ70229.1 MAG: ribosome-associated protein [Candidatus Kentron sp. FM]VFK20045.1 MAG: ribosome-associated protein [Candidatus Kentron sp. FM]